MATLNVIRRWALREQLSMREIARRTGRARNTVKKYLRSDLTEPQYPKRISSRKLDPYAEKLTTWLQTEVTHSRKQRRTLRQIHTVGHLEKPRDLWAIDLAAHTQSHRGGRGRGGVHESFLVRRNGVGMAAVLSDGWRCPNGLFDDPANRQTLNQDRKNHHAVSQGGNSFAFRSARNRQRQCHRDAAAKPAPNHDM